MSVGQVRPPGFLRLLTCTSCFPLGTAASPKRSARKDSQERATGTVCTGRSLSSRAGVCCSLYLLCAGLHGSHLVRELWDHGSVLIKWEQPRGLHAEGADGSRRERQSPSCSSLVQGRTGIQTAPEIRPQDAARGPTEQHKRHKHMSVPF